MQHAYLVSESKKSIKQLVFSVPYGQHFYLLLSPHQLEWLCFVVHVWQLTKGDVSLTSSVKYSILAFATFFSDLLLLNIE